MGFEAMGRQGEKKSAMTVSEDQGGMKRAPAKRGELPGRADTGN
jgi:hypothetical protein